MPLPCSKAFHGSLLSWIKSPSSYVRHCFSKLLNLSVPLFSQLKKRNKNSIPLTNLYDSRLSHLSPLPFPIITLFEPALPWTCQAMILPQGFALAVPSTWMALSPEISPVYLLTSSKPLPKGTSQWFPWLPYSKLQPSPFHSPHNSETYFSVYLLHLSYHHLFYLLFVFLFLLDCKLLYNRFFLVFFFFFYCQGTPHLPGKYLVQCRCLINEWLND